LIETLAFRKRIQEDRKPGSARRNDAGSEQFVISSALFQDSAPTLVHAFFAEDAFVKFGQRDIAPHSSKRAVDSNCLISLIDERLVFSEL